MSTDERGSAEEFARLKRERDEADRHYNEALTKLDTAIQKPRDLPHPPPPYDEFQITPLNERWELLSLKPDEGRGWLRRFRTHAWAMVAPLFERQQTFNSALVDHVNRNIAVHRETTRALENTIAMLREDRQRLIEYQTLHILYAQQITPYVDTKDRLLLLSDELRTMLSVMQRAVQTLKREVERNAGVSAGSFSPEDVGPGFSPASDAGLKASPTSGRPAAARSTKAEALDSYKYVGFEDRFRGSQHEIRERMAAYVPLFEGASDVLDVGCGRGEFLELVREKGISARGIDLNDEMVAVCRERGLDATVADALGYLLAQPDGSLGGLFAAQVVEHFEPEYLMRFLNAAYHKLRPGSKIVLETINPTCWYAFFSSYIRDVTHVRPLHPDTLQYLVGASGFQKVAVRYSAPFPEESKLQTVPAPAGTHQAADSTAAIESVFNENMKKLNSLFFTYLDYAAIAERL
jgi:2-polyprenyl-3-methyl-5-hydroxy-6-metoxy-1,4-benzoquinol methylase